MFEGESASVEVFGDTKGPRPQGASKSKDTVLGSRTPLLAATVIFALTITFGRDFLYNYFSLPFGIAATAASIAGLFFFLIFLNLFGRRRVPLKAAPASPFPKHFTLTASPDGLHINSGNFHAHYKWPGILRLNDSENDFFLYTENAQEIVVPKRCFPSREEASRFAIIVRSNLGHSA
jgi:hypothetical protein